MKTLSFARALTAASALAATLATAACSSTDLAGTNVQNVQPVAVSFTAGASTPSAVINASANGTSFTPTPIPEVTNVRLVITKLELARTDDASCLGDDAEATGIASSTPSPDNSECEHVTREPQLIDMPVDGTLRTQISVSLPPGTYRKMEARLGVVSDKTASGAAFLAAHPEFAGASLRVDGTYNGAPFTYTLELKANIAMKFSPALVIDGTNKNATVAVDVSKWFITINGIVMDPSRSTPGTPSATIIENNVRASFRAFEDNSRRGK